MKSLKRIITFLPLCFLMLCLNAMAQSFEGTISLQTFTKEVDENADIKWYVKDNNHKLEISGRTAEHTYQYKILLLAGDPNLKMVSEEGGETLVFNVPPRKSDVISGGAAELVRTQETKIIAGYTCEKIKLINYNGVTTCWVSDAVQLPAEQFPNWLKSNAVYQTLAQHQVKAFPMEIETINQDGELSYALKVNTVNPTKLDAAEFKLPASYEDGEEAIKKSFSTH